MLAGGLLILAGCGGSTHVVTKVVTQTRPATVSTIAPKPTSPAPNAAATAAAGSFAATAVAADAAQVAAPVGDAVFAPAAIAAAGTLSIQSPSSTSSVTPSTTVAPKVVAGHASGEYAVAYTDGTFHHPSKIVLTVSVSPAQTGSVDWNVVCFETSGGIGRNEGRATISLPTTKTLPLPAPSSSCIASANVQLSRTGNVTISISG